MRAQVKIFLNIALSLALVAAQVSLISGLPGWFSSLNLLLLALVYFLVMFGLDFSILMGIILGFLYGLFSFLPLGASLFGFLATIYIADLLLNNFFTNRSLYSFVALSVIATIVNGFFIFAFLKLFYFLAQSESLAPGKDYFIFLGRQVVLNSAAMAVLFYLTNFASKRFKPVFLIKAKR